MRTNKPAVIWSVIVSIVSLVVSLVLNYFDCGYWSNLFAGIFASGVLTVMISIINYCMERRKTLERFFYHAQRAVNNYSRLEDDGDLEKSIDSILKMSEFDYVELDNAYGDMDFLFRDKEKREYIYKKIYEPTLSFRVLIATKCYHFKEYRKSTNGNLLMMRKMVDEVAAEFMEETERKEIDKNGKEIIIKTRKNKAVEQLREELGGKYYEIMYMKTKR